MKIGKLQNEDWWWPGNTRAGNAFGIVEEITG